MRTTSGVNVRLCKGAHPCEPGMNWTGDTPLTKIGPPHSLGQFMCSDVRPRQGRRRWPREVAGREKLYISGGNCLVFSPQFAQGYHLM